MAVSNDGIIWKRDKIWHVYVVFLSLNVSRQPIPTQLLQMFGLLVCRWWKWQVANTHTHMTTCLLSWRLLLMRNHPRYQSISQMMHATLLLLGKYIMQRKRSWEECNSSDYCLFLAYTRMQRNDRLMQNCLNILLSKSTKMSTWIWPSGQMMLSLHECQTTRSIRCTATFPFLTLCHWLHTYIHTIHQFYHQYHSQARTFIQTRNTITHTCREKISFIKQLCCTLKKEWWS